MGNERSGPGGRATTRFSLVLMGLVLASCLIVAPASASARPIGHWKFNNTFKNSAKTQLKLTDVPAGSTAFLLTTIDGVNKTACFVAAGNGLKVTRIPRAARENYTVDIYFITNDVTSFKRLMSFGPNNIDRGLYVVGGHVELYPGALGTNPSIVADTWVHVAVTRSGRSGRLRVYVDGAQELTFSDKRGRFELKRGKVVFFQDDTTEHMAGFIKDVRIYDRVLVPS